MSWSHSTKSTLLDGKWRSGTSQKTTELTCEWLSSLYWAICHPAWQNLYHVTSSCKGPILLKLSSYICCEKQLGDFVNIHTIYLWRSFPLFLWPACLIMDWYNCILIQLYIKQLTPNNANLQRKSKLLVMVSSSYQGKKYRENGLKGKNIHFELAGGSSYQRFELLGVNCMPISIEA